ncbi:MAG: type II toxin-antitoxin system VapC family toxin [Archaeoglobaceae archaeon]
MITLDTSVILDSLLKRLGERFYKANKILSLTENAEIFSPKVLIVELTAILARRKDRILVKNLVEGISGELNLVSENEIFEIAREVSLSTGCREIDAYFIATAKLTNSILITNDRIMAENAKKYGIEAYYLIDEFDKAIERISGFKSL